ncbi:MAG: TonB-dependent receptor [Cyclobacteriaceae bacterium]|nr:TonB-dependent receptor [Cyclobacteriaceae bacterium HetDA_MAG_MS6]
MIKLFTRQLFGIFICCFSLSVFSQTTISGTITDEATGEALIGANVLVKGTVLGTITDISGNFSLNVSSSPPLTLVVSSVGYTRQEIEINNANVSGLPILMSESTLLGQEVVVSASRVEESILESPVTVEKMDILAVQNSSSDDYYKGLMNLKGVDMTSSSINFQIINARGFSSTGNTRFVQLTDGMDTQAPALNFPIGNLNGPSVLDVESVELIPGASSALYGPNAFNGILLVTSKNPFDYQGASAYAKVGVNHIGSEADQDAAPLYEVSARYAKAFNNKFAFKASVSYSQADDWHGTSLIDRNSNLNPFTSIGGENPGPDRHHVMGDEASLNLNILRFSTSSADGLGYQTVGSTGSGFFEPGQTGWTLAQAGFLPNHVVTTPGYVEEFVVDYGAENLKLAGGLYYRLNDNLELSYLYNGGFGTSVYTGAQRYSLKNFWVHQHRLQLRGDNFFIRAYTTRENSGDSYISEFLGVNINEQRFGSLNNYFTGYANVYLRHLYDLGYRTTSDPTAVTPQEQLAAHNAARASMLAQNPLEPGSSEFNRLSDNAFADADGNPLTIPNGPVFNDKSNMYHAEVQYNFKNEISFMDLTGGFSYRSFELRSNGTIFDDQGGVFINEFGGYLLAAKSVTPDLKLSGSLRYDKNENFDGQLNPRISAVYTIANNHNIRGSIQTGFRNPTTQGQYIDLDILSSRLVGGLPQFYEKYDIPRQSSTGVPLSYTTESVAAWRNTIFGGEEDRDLLVPVTEMDPVKPERVRSIEFGYKGLFDRLLVDAVYYFSRYTDFIAQPGIIVASEADAAAVTADPTLMVGGPNYNSMLRSTGSNTFFPYTNLNSIVKTQGAAVGLTYSFSGGYILGTNYNWNEFISGSEGFLNDFNTPEHKFNVTLANRKVVDNVGFSLGFRWQDEFTWESAFAQGQVPAYTNLDAQISYKMQNLKSILRIGGSNILNKQYFQSLGGPDIGAIYYVSITFDELMN